MKWRAEPKLLRQPVHLFAFGFGAGLSPCGAGNVRHVDRDSDRAARAAVRLASRMSCLRASRSSVASTLCGESARRLDVHDHPGIVWDEIAGYTVTMLAAPPHWYWLLCGFVLFRIFRHRQTLADPGGRSQSHRRAGNYAG